MAKLPLRRRDGSIAAYTIVDDDDFDRLVGFRWWLHSEGYACRSTGPRHNRHNVRLHRDIFGLKRGDKRQVDHVNRDRLDNRRANLRLASHAQNHQNLQSYRGSGSRFRGVSWHRARGRWRATVCLRGRQHHLGLFDSEIDAAAAAAAFRAEHMPFSSDAAQPA